MAKILLDSYSTQVLESMNAATWIWHVDTSKVIINNRWAEVIGYSILDFPNPVVDDFTRTIHPDDLADLYTSFYELFSKKKQIYSQIIRRKHKDGHYVYVLDSGQVVKWSTKAEPLVVVGAHIDISELKFDTIKTETTAKYITEIVENTQDIIYRLDLDGNFTYLSKAWTTELGHGILDVIGSSFVPYVHPDDVDMLNDFFDNIKKTTTHHSLYGYRLRHSNGEFKYFETNASPIIENGIVLGYAGIARNITEVIQRDKEIDYLIYHDQLTTLYNRHYLDKLNSLFQKKELYPACFIVSDLNDLKYLNDIYGHVKGDEAIKTAALILKAHIPSNYLFRMGGDEFLAIIPNCDKYNINEIINNINIDLENINKQNFPLSLSFGYHIKTAMSTNIYTDISLADQSMYENKKIYHNRKNDKERYEQ